MSVTVVVSFPISSFSQFILFFPFPLSFCFLSFFLFLFSFPPVLPVPLTPCFSSCVPPSRCCSIFKRPCSAQVILAAAGEESDKSLMLEKRVCGTLGTQRQYQLLCRKKERWRKEETRRWTGRL